VVGVIEGRTNTSGKMIGLRADMDALPITECNAFAHKSTVPGRMHACGHDGHTTMLLGAARYLAATREFDGTAVMIFQPGEEGYAGAREMIQDGLFDRFPCNEVYALHNWPALPAGSIGVSPGPAMAAADRVDITITGKGGHGAHPYLAVDPVLVAAHVITSAQSIVSRNVNPLESAVVSLCSVQAGELDAMSVIPSEARITGTVRTFKREIQDLVEERLKHMVHTIADGFGAKAKVTYTRIYPATTNHGRQAAFAADVAASLVGESQVVRDLPPSMGAEDFSFMLQAKPGAYLRLGQGGGEHGRFLHSTQYDFNDAVLPLGAALLASLATHAMPPRP
jgi:hippurate hydrolase